MEQVARSRSIRCSGTIVYSKLDMVHTLPFHLSHKSTHICHGTQMRHSRQLAAVRKICHSGSRLLRVYSPRSARTRPPPPPPYHDHDMALHTCKATNSSLHVSTAFLAIEPLAARVWASHRLSTYRNNAAHTAPSQGTVVKMNPTAWTVVAGCDYRSEWERAIPHERVANGQEIRCSS